MTLRGTAAVAVLGAAAAGLATFSVRAPASPPLFDFFDPFAGEGKPGSIGVEVGDRGSPGWHLLRVERTPGRGGTVFRVHAETNEPGALDRLLVEAADDRNGNHRIDPEEVEVLAGAAARGEGDRQVATTGPFRVTRHRAWFRIRREGGGGEGWSNIWSDAGIESGL